MIAMTTSSSIRVKAPALAQRDAAVAGHASLLAGHEFPLPSGGTPWPEAARTALRPAIIRGHFTLTTSAPIGKTGMPILLVLGMPQG